MDALKALPDLSNHELFELVASISARPEFNSIYFLVRLAAELRQRQFHVTEDYVLGLAAKLDPFTSTTTKDA